MFRVEGLGVQGCEIRVEGLVIRVEGSYLPDLLIVGLRGLGL